MKQIWTGRMAQTAARYGEHAPMATVCCNACRTCTTTNVLTLAAGRRSRRRLRGRPDGSATSSAPLSYALGPPSG